MKYTNFAGEMWMKRKTSSQTAENQYHVTA